MNKYIETYNSKNIFFTSDTHFGHKNILHYCQRPFEDVTQMNEVLIENWNSVVPKDGIVFHLGDFAFGDSDYWASILDSLNGKIHLIIGNHDIRMLKSSAMNLFAEVNFQKIINVDGKHIILNHYPLLCYSGENRGQWQLFGHVHSGKYSNKGFDITRLEHLFSTQYDVGVDNNNFRPISYKEIKETLSLHHPK